MDTSSEWIRYRLMGRDGEGDEEGREEEAFRLVQSKLNELCW